MWIHEQKDWPNFTWDGALLAPKLADIRHRQGLLLGRMATMGFDLKQEASLNTLTSDVVKSSQIEGEILNPNEVRSSIARRLGVDIGGLLPVNHHVEGVVDMMLDATQHYDQPLTADRLFVWHGALFPTGRSGIQHITIGTWRSESAGIMRVVSGPVGKEKVHFEAVAASRLSVEMQRFLNWFEGKQPSIDPVIKAGLAHFWFVTIHPFEDGNGRIARAIADMALARADGTCDRFYSMSTQIEAEHKTYYNQLEHQQRGLMDVTEWLDWFLDCLGRAIDQATTILASVLYKAQLWAKINLQPIHERQRLIINQMLGDFKGPMNTSKYAKLAKCSPDTALRDIKELAERGILVQNPAGGRSTSYRLVGAIQQAVDRF